MLLSAPPSACHTRVHSCMYACELIDARAEEGQSLSMRGGADVYCSISQLMLPLWRPTQAAREAGGEAGGGDAVEPRLPRRRDQHRPRVARLVAIHVSQQAAAGEA